MSIYPYTNFNVVLVEPEIPQNTGNIGRICAGSYSHLHLVEPLGFDLSDKQVKRAGLDYWPGLQWSRHTSLEAWRVTVKDYRRVFFFSTKGVKPYYETRFQKGDVFVFGKETQGLPENLLEEYKEQVLTIPFPGKIRSFNLANAVAMTLGEGLRQLGQVAQ